MRGRNRSPALRDSPRGHAAPEAAAPAVPALVQRAAALPGHGLSAGDALRLQRAVGNGATGALLRAAAGVQRVTGGPVVQRYALRRVDYWSPEARRVREERLSRNNFDVGPNFASLTDGGYNDVAVSAGHDMHSEVRLVGGAAIADGAQSRDAKELFRYYRWMKQSGRRADAQLYTERHPCHNAGIDGQGCERSLNLALDGDDEVCFSVNANNELAGHLEDLSHEAVLRDEHRERERQREEQERYEMDLMDEMEHEEEMRRAQEAEDEEWDAPVVTMEDVWEHRVGDLLSTSLTWFEKLDLVRRFPELLDRLRRFGEDDLAGRLQAGM
jgi:hypothetical protein